VQDLFEDIDTDGSGGVSLEELTEGLTKQGYNLTPNEIEQLVCVCVCVCVCDPQRD
jgi:Ca2+-binding EF-hand superfamily protein